VPKYFQHLPWFPSSCNIKILDSYNAYGKRILQTSCHNLSLFLYPAYHIDILKQYVLKKDRKGKRKVIKPWLHAIYGHMQPLFSRLRDIKFSRLGALGAAIEARNLDGVLFPTNLPMGLFQDTGYMVTLHFF